MGKSVLATLSGSAQKFYRINIITVFWTDRRELGCLEEWKGIPALTRYTSNRPKQLISIDLIIEFRTVDRWKSELGLLEMIPVAARCIQRRLKNVKGSILLPTFERLVVRSPNLVNWWMRTSCGALAPWLSVVEWRAWRTWFLLRRRNDFLVYLWANSRLSAIIRISDMMTNLIRRFVNNISCTKTCLSA